MAEIISFFVTLNGVPQVGLSPLPTITIYDAVTNSVVLTDITQEVGGGFYKYEIATLNPDIDYLIIADAGSAFPNAERYSYGEIDSLNALAANTIWNYPSTGSFDSNSFGALLSTIDNTTSVSYTLLDILLKYQTNRTKVDQNAKTLTVYDDDQATPIKVFKLLNQNGVLDVNTVFERLPQ